jgi:CRISPR-associated protein Csm3
MQLTHIRKITGQIELVSGLHIGGSNIEMHIGGTDNPVIKNPFNNQPYIPGSSLKGKMRSLLEWRAGVVGITDGNPLGFGDVIRLEGAQEAQGKNLLKLFGGAPESSADEALLKEIGPTRLAFWDCNLDTGWIQEMADKNLLLTETKMETAIDRIQGVAAKGSLRTTERVPAGARFDFHLTVKVHDSEDLLPDVLTGLKLLEYTGLGGSGSRGYGKIRFLDLAMDGEGLQARLDQLQLD